MAHYANLRDVVRWRSPVDAVEVLLREMMERWLDDPEPPAFLAVARHFGTHAVYVIEAQTWPEARRIADPHKSELDRLGWHPMRWEGSWCQPVELMRACLVEARRNMSEHLIH